MSSIDAGEPSQEARATEIVLSRLDMWKTCVNILRGEFGQEFSPYDVHQLIKYIMQDETEAGAEDE